MRNHKRTRAQEHLFQQLTVTSEQDGTTHHASLASLLAHDGLRYEMVLEDSLFVDHMLRLSINELTKRRRRYADAGGLVC